MRIEDNKLYIDEEIGYDSKDELLSLSSEVDEIVVNTNDIHPTIMQLLFCIKQEKIITVDDEFNKRFFENLEMVS